MTFTVIGTPRIESEYSDAWETTMVFDLQREDGETGDVWIIAGVPDYNRGSASASGSQYGYETVRVFGDSVDMWCPESFRIADEDGCYQSVRDAVIAACETAARLTHAKQRYLAKLIAQKENAQRKGKEG